MACLTLGCGDAVPPKPYVYPGWEQLQVSRLNSNGFCLYSRTPTICHDTTTLRKMGCISLNTPIDFESWSVLLYFEDIYNNITALNPQAYLFINHAQQTVRLDVATRATPNRSGLTTVGHSERAVHVLKIPKIPIGYKIIVQRV